MGLVGPERIRQVPIHGTWAYVSRISSCPGERISAHVRAESEHQIAVIRLGRDAVLDPTAGVSADRADIQELATWHHPQALPAEIAPGSYIHCHGDPIPGGTASVGLWLRPWRLPRIDRIQVAWSAVMGDLDYPDHCRFGLLIDHLGRIAAYSGDGGAFRHERLTHTRALLHERLGTWIHVIAVWDGSTVRIWVDDQEEASSAAGPIADPGTTSRLRIGAMAEGGQADDFLDADISRPFIARSALSSAEIARVVDDRGRTSFAELGVETLLATWPLDEETGAVAADVSGHGRHGQIVNHGTWMIGGPAFDPVGRKPSTYTPDSDVDRGHGLRLSSDDLVDAGWNSSAEYEVPEDADSGFYAIQVRQPGQAPHQMTTTPFVVSRRKPRSPGSIVLVAATNTWYAYGRRPTNETPVAGLSSSFYSVHTSGQPFFHVGTRIPIPGADPHRYELRRAERTQSNHLGRPERIAEAWLTREGYAHEVVTDLDVHEEPDLLRRFAAVMICGHSEYWTAEMRDGLIAFLDGGGNVISMSGDTLSVRVSFEEDEGVIEARKVVDGVDDRWLEPDRWGERWHSVDGAAGGSWRLSGEPGWEALGMNFKGMIDDGLSPAFKPYRVLLPDHPLLTVPQLVPISSDGTIGDRSLNGRGGASGYEFDANLDRVGLADAPLEGVETIASARPQANLEWIGEPDHGADLIFWKRPAGGEVLNFGSIAASGALPVDPGIAGLTRNALARFGVARSGARAVSALK